MYCSYTPASRSLPASFSTKNPAQEPAGLFRAALRWAASLARSCTARTLPRLALLLVFFVPCFVAVRLSFSHALRVHSLSRSFRASPGTKNPAQEPAGLFRPMPHASLRCVSRSVMHFVCTPSLVPSAPRLERKILRRNLLLFFVPCFVAVRLSFSHALRVHSLSRSFRASPGTKNPAQEPAGLFRAALRWAASLARSRTSCVFPRYSCDCRRARSRYAACCSGVASAWWCVRHSSYGIP